MEKVSYLDKMMGVSSSYNAWIEATHKLRTSLKNSEKLTITVDPNKPNICCIKNNTTGEYGSVALKTITTGSPGIELTITTYSILLKSDVHVSVFIPYEATVIDAAMIVGGGLVSIERSVQMTHIALKPGELPRPLSKLECGTPILDKTLKLLLGAVYFDDILYAFRK